MNYTSINIWQNIWHDENGEHSEWCVDECDENGNSEVIRCFRDWDSAAKFADQHSEETGLPIED